MAPPCILLNRKVLFEHHAAVFGGGTGERGGELIGGGSGRTRGVPSRQDMTDAILAYLRVMKPDAHFANLPELSSLRLLRPTESIPPLCEDITSGYIASADKNLVALYAGPYRPGTYLKGCYLIYDAMNNSLSTNPQSPYDSCRAGVGLGAIVLRRDGGEGAYVIGELTKVKGSNPPEAALCTWQSSTAEWVKKVGYFPPELCPPNHLFMADMCFSIGGCILCWVDMFKGMVVCDLRAVLEHGSNPEFRFIPLPGECPTYNRGDRFKWPLRAEEFRSIACVGGAIKFVTMDGYGERPGHEVTLTMWTLLPDLCNWNLWNWKKGKVYHVKDIWANKTHLLMGLPRLLPSFPVLSLHEDDVVYLVFTDLRLVNGQVEYKSQFLLRVDMQRNKVEYHPESTGRIHSQLFASECSAYLQGLEDHPEKVKARKVGESGKRMAL